MPDSPPDDLRGDGPDRTAKIEELLLAGLDHYFAGEHDRAISVWTRVLFLDRGHARARAYIERARSALAERQRESEELIQQGVTAFNAGRAEAARELLASAVAQGGPHDVALALLERLDRLETASQTPTPAPSSGRPSATPREPADQERWRAGWFVFAALLVAAAAVGWAIYVSMANPSLWPAGPPMPRAAAGRPAPDLLPLPRSADLALARARQLTAAGHLKDALAALEAITPGDPAHPEAERLRADLQAALLAGLPPIPQTK
ncbi:MAG: hypothetical protein ACM3NQ_18120 [Bacteroidales bacterium]